MNKKLKKLTVALAAALTAVSAGAFTAFADSGDVEINKTNFPDDVFRQYVSENCDTDGNGVLSQGEIDAVYGINVSEKNIADLKGIEYFSALTFLDCGNNQLASLDVSKSTALASLRCDNNQLASLDISNNTALTFLYCGWNQITELNVSKNTALTSLWCTNNQLTSLDVSKNTALKTLVCDANQLTSLDISQNTALTSLHCHGNQLTNLDVSQNNALTSLSCSYNQLENIDVSQNIALTELHCNDNQLISLDVSQNTALTELDCGNYNRTNLNNRLTSLDVSKNTALTKLSCRWNQLTNLDVSKNTTLTELYCGGNQLASLDVSQNHLTILDVSNNTALTKLWCNNNNLTSLDLSTNTALTDVNSVDNTYSIGKVTSYDLKNLPAGFDISKASNWQGATLDGSVLTNFTSDKITYTYDCGNGISETFTLTTTQKADDPDSDPVSAFVNRLYTIILDRPAEEAGLADWTSSLKSGESTSADIVYGLANSQEFTGKNLSNDEVIERMYLSMLGRPSDEGGKADWLDAMANGCTVNGIINGFSGSQEFANICAGYGISAGSVTSCEPRDKNVNLTAFVSRMYTKALGRAYDVSGLNDWTNDYLNGKATANDIAYGFILSQEFEGRNLSDEAYVDTLYRTFFDREPDEGGKAGWLDELAKGTSRKDVLDGFLGAEEFANLKAGFGV